ncbi:RNA-binding protein [Natribacillus halophilus]|uniref:RNA-binding protein YlmH, contains S4-like domain n=1 Tax=Natribacillus halophilus TaxID=549003 RepID=A0A1G8MFM1_9BACI|nr:YlmH/Sll1252 family protein [Natribacillus halophilus]SDI66716.1 RNA-binding protein YlmH, contains S4-like domain [Natribacillus halophilus]
MDIYQHFRKEEIPFIQQVEDWKTNVGTMYEAKLSNFLDPRERDIVAAVVGQDDTVNVAFFGGVAAAERQRALLYPFYEHAEEDRFQVELFEVDYDRKFANIQHRDLLGALTSLGVKRELFGDITVTNEVLQFFVAEEIGDFVRLNLTKTGNMPLALRSQPLAKAVRTEEHWQEDAGFVSSLRLDVVIAAIYHLPRAKVKPYIERERVKLNWKVVDQPGTLVTEGDVISVRGKGRSKLIAVEERSRKGRLRIVYGRKRL